MAGVGAQAYTFQLSSKAAEKTGGNVEQYRLQLEPGINVPFTAQCRCQLEQLAFAMTITNVDATLYNNNKIVFEWDPYISDLSSSPDIDTMRYSQGAGAGKPKRYELTVPDGTYSLADLEVFISRELYQKTNMIDYYDGSVYPAETYVNVIKEIRPTSGLFWDMDVMARSRPNATGDTVTIANGDNGISALTTSMSLVTVQEQIGTVYVGGAFEIGGVKRRIVTVNTDGLEANQDQPASDTGTWAALPKTRILVDTPWGKAASLNDSTAQGIILHPPSALPDDIDDAVDFLGFGGAGAAFPSELPTSGWGASFSMDELQIIAHTDGTAAASVAPTYVTGTKTEQSLRKVKPVTLSVDPITHKVQAACASPLFKITDESTVFSKLLGFDTFTDQNMLQLPSATANLPPWLADNHEMITRTRAIEFHCPTLVTSSYDQQGKQTGGSLAQVPITKQRGETEVWQAAYDNSVPIAFHGGTIDSLTFSLTNQDGDPVNLQGTDFNATLRITWPDPVPPAIGSAGADAEDAYGLRDVKYIS